MKKILAIILASLMLLTLVACNNGGNTTEETTGNGTAQSEPTQNETDKEEESTTAGETAPEVKLPAHIMVNTEVTYEDPTTTLGYYFWQKFVEVKEANASATSEQIVQAIFESNLVTAIQMPMAFELEEGAYLQGFLYENENGEEVIISGHESGYMFGSGMMGVAFVGYVFDLADGADTAAFMDMLNANKEPRWNGCTIADMTVIDAIGNTVFMVMCPIPAPYAISGIPEIMAPETEAGSLEEKVWNKYVDVLTENYELTAAEVCALLAAELGTDAEVVDYGYDGIPADNFQFEIYDYMSAASFNGDANKIVYVINNYDGLDMMSWADYYFVMGGKYETVFGSFNASIIAIVDTSAPIAE